jgi:hypothetical protein
LSDSKAGMFMSSVFLLKNPVTGCFAKPAIPKSPKSKLK